MVDGNLRFLALEQTPSGTGSCTSLHPVPRTSTELMESILGGGATVGICHANPWVMLVKWLIAITKYSSIMAHYRSQAAILVHDACYQCLKIANGV